MIDLVHVLGTYRMLRLIAGWTILVVPFAIVAIGYAVDPRVLPTLSHYYFLENFAGPVRTSFTGFLIFSGGIFIAYRGFDNRDNVVYWLAGFCAICVAFFPKLCDKAGEANCGHGLLSWFHMPAAVLLFLFAAYAVARCGKQSTLSSNLSEQEKSLLARWKYISIILMASGIAYYAGRFALGAPPEDFRIAGLIVELLGFVGFAAHWLSLSFVISRANERIKATLRIENQAMPPSGPIP